MTEIVAGRIDWESAPIDELSARISKLGDEINYYSMCEQAVKRFINSIYGAQANRFYEFYNVDVAASITAQAQDLIKFSMKMVDYYFKNVWHRDLELHRFIAADMSAKYPGFDASGFLEKATVPLAFETMIVYGDTDSSYVSLQSIMTACDIKAEQATDMILSIYHNRFSDYLNMCFESYAKKFNCPKNIENFELEKIARTVIMEAKKRYVMDLSWKEPDVFVEPLHSVLYKGIEVVKGDTPPYYRECMKDFIGYVLTEYNNGRGFEYSEIIRKVREYKQLSSLQDPDRICKSISINDYSKYVLDDKNSLVFNTELVGKPVQSDDDDDDIVAAKGKKMSCPIHVRGAAIYNHALYTTAKKYARKYENIKNGDKVRFYYAKGITDDTDAFSYLPNNFPMEFAPEIDIDTMFEKYLLSPLNRIISCTGNHEVSSSLTYSASLW